MLNESRIGIYNYVKGLLTNATTAAIYPMYEPQELTEADTTNGFIIIRVGQLNDESQFRGMTYAWARVFVEAYVPPLKRGRLNTSLYETLETEISTAIETEIDQGIDATYCIEDDGVLSMDGSDDSNANNLYHMYVKSFIVTVH